MHSRHLSDSIRSPIVEIVYGLSPVRSQQEHCKIGIVHAAHRPVMGAFIHKRPLLEALRLPFVLGEEFIDGLLQFSGELKSSQYTEKHTKP